MKRTSGGAHALLYALGCACHRIVADDSDLPGSRTGKKPVTLASEEAQFRRQNNAITVGLGGIMNGTFMRFVDDIARVVDDGDNLRVLPIVGKGSALNLRDLLYLKGVDLAIISAQSLIEFKNQKGYHNLQDRICYVTFLYPEELHVFSDKVGSVEELSGKIVGFDGTGSRLAAEALFTSLGVQPKQMLPFNLVDAAETMKSRELVRLCVLAASRLATLAKCTRQTKTSNCWRCPSPTPWLRTSSPPTL
jgi:TRAP-type uncharacterized transport system substrate-binding protein